MAESTGKLLLRIAPITYGPNTMFGLGEGAIVPVIPVVAASLGADIATAGLVASMIVIGRMVGNLPAGWIVSRFGERAAILGGAILGLAAIVTAALANTLALFTLTIFIIGMCDAVFALARHAFMTTRVPLDFRARAIALLGGSYRFGIFVGPFISALLLGLTGNELAAAWFFAAMFIGIGVLVIVGGDPEKKFDEQRVGGQGSGQGGVTDEAAGDAAETGTAETDGTEAGSTVIARTETGAAASDVPSVDAAAESESPDEAAGDTALVDDNAGIFRTMLNYRAVLLRLGVAAATISAVRGARTVVLPLWGVSIGMDAQSIAIVVGISGAIDFALFYASGQVMDRFGRLWAALPSMLLMGLGFFVLAFTHDLEGAVIWYTVLSCVIAVGNGLSSGILMTLGADVAPRRNPAPFLGSWRTLTDAGGALAPLLFSAIAAVTVLGVPTGLIGGLGFFGAIGLARWIPRFITHTPKRALADDPDNLDSAGETNGQ